MLALRLSRLAKSSIHHIHPIILFRMIITKVTSTFAETTVHTDYGKFLLGTKRYVLQAGVAILHPMDGTLKLPTVVIPSIGEVPEYDITPHPELLIKDEGTTDPQLVCIARRGWSAHQNSDVPDESPVPTLDEAAAELSSGHDANGEPWPVPRVPAVPLEEALAEAGKLKGGN
jgi:hypothetical protein